MKRVLAFGCFVFVFGFTAYGERIVVKQDGTGNFTRIQQAINASYNGDTVLVYPGTYYENINYNGKSITVASLYLLTHADSLIHQTIIDGNHNGSVVLIISGENENTLLCGFTLQNGSGSVFYDNSYRGGGIGIKNAHPQIKKCLIRNNKSDGGGGLFCSNSFVFLSGNTISNNHGIYGGGSIMLLDHTSVIFDSIIRNNIYLNYSSFGTEIYKSSTCPAVHVVADTFTVNNPDKYYIASIDLFGFPVFDITTDILHAKVQTANADLYVSPLGNNDNSGLTPEDPLLSLSFALTKIATDSISLSPKNIYLANGTFSQFLTGEYFPLNLRSNVNIIGNNCDSTILDAEHLYHHFRGHNTVCNFLLKNLSLINGYANSDLSPVATGSISLYYCNNINLENLLISGNICIGVVSPAVVSIGNTDKLYLNKIQIVNNTGIPLSIGSINTLRSFLAENCIIQHNLPDGDPETWDGGGISIAGDGWIPPFIQGTFKNLVVVQNQKDLTGALSASEAIGIMSSSINIVNATIGDNTSPIGGGISMSSGSELNLYNSIVYGNTPPAFFVHRGDNSYPPSVLNINHTLVEGGENGIVDYTGDNTITYGEGNIDSIPRWDYGSEYPYSLANNSPCIDAGTNEVPGITLPEYDIIGNPRIVGGIVDMGAYEYQDTLTVVRDRIFVNKNTLIHVYPNPFTASTLISISLASSCRLEVVIYDLLGKKIKSLSDAKLSKGNYNMVWDGDDDNKLPVSSGEYIAVIIKDGQLVESTPVHKIR
ncbi:MAG: DUF1565 domain-containing protein [Bacteroidales bacterium]|jgi:hypothetical protein|nr:DUF1565 domain-containing protein [Bacteroidales bacterium]